MHASPIVYLESCTSYEKKQLQCFFDQCFSDIPDISLNNCSVLVKPNLISSKSSGPACTDPRFLIALCEWLLDHRAHVGIGDSPAFGSARSVLKALGIDERLAKIGVEVVNFDSVIKKRLACGIEVGIAKEPLQYQYFFNAPKVKAHSQMGVTMAVKNLFGIVLGMRKAMLHMRHGGGDNRFSAIILDLIKLLPAHFSIIDGIEAMTRQGPLHGDSLDLGCIGFSLDPIALDTALLAALRVNPYMSRLWCEAKARKYAGAELDNITFPRLTPQFFHDIQFEAPAELSPIRFNPFRFISGGVKRLQMKIGR